jgi:serine/threonine-protein kinase
VQPGQVLAGKYRVERVLGQGGMGVVVAAHHLQLDSKVALKFLLPEMLANREAVVRFEREARAAVKITNEHVARVLDVGTLESGAPYMVMELLDGTDLAAWLNERGVLPIDQAVEFLLHACVAVAEAHGLGIVHRDLKPANLFCVRRADGQLSVKVLDFGISKQTDPMGSGSQPGASVTKTSMIMGSPLYMSPEQMRSTKGADARSDIWALGVILYELLTARLPFEGETATDIAVKASIQPPPPIRGYRPDVPAELEAVILRCLEKDPSRRFPNVAELALALAPFAPKRARSSVERIAGTIQAAGLSNSALNLPISPAGVPGTLMSAGGSVPPVGQTSSRTAPGRAGPLLAALAVVGLLAAAGVAVVVMRGRSHAMPAAEQASATSAASASVTPPALPSASSLAAVAPSPVDSALADSPVPEAGSTATAPSAASHGRTPPRSAATPPATPAVTAHPQAPSANCDPPYTLDDQGLKHFKPECYLNK